MKKILFLGIASLLLTILSIQAKKGAIAPSYGAFLNRLFPPKEICYPIAQQAIWEPTKKVTLIGTHKYPGEYSVFLLLPKTKGPQKFPEIGNVQLTLSPRETEQTTNKKPKTMASPGTPVFVDGMHGKKYTTYNFPQDTQNEKNLAFDIAFLGDISPLFIENEKILCAIYAVPKPPNPK